MAKAKKKRRVIQSHSIGALKEAAAKNFGVEGAYVGSEHGKYFRGIPFQSIALEYLFGSNMLILGMTYGISGPPQSFKSALALEFIRLLLSYGGSGFHVETEGRKISAPMLEAILGKHIDDVVMRPVDSVEKAQDALTWAVDFEKTSFPDKNNLLALAIDSLSGAATEERAESIAKEGHAKRDFSSEALYWSKWLNTYGSKLAGWPMALFIVNHEKPKMEDKTGHGKTITGGWAQQFYATTYLSVRRVGENRGATHTITALSIKSSKNSFGEYNRKILVPFIYGHKGVTMTFDWGHAAAQMLLDNAAKVKEFLEVKSSSPSMTAQTRTFSCKQLGVTQVSGEEFGLALQAQPELLEQLRSAPLGITRYKLFEGAMPDSIGEKVETAECGPDDTMDDIDP